MQERVMNNVVFEEDEQCWVVNFEGFSGGFFMNFEQFHF